MKALLGAIILLGALSACGQQGQQTPGGQQLPEPPHSPVVTVATPVGPASPLPPTDKTPRDDLRKHMQDLNLLQGGGCLPSNCVLVVRMMIDTAQQTRETIARQPDRDKFRPALAIIDKLKTVPADQLGDPATQQRVFDITAELQLWLAKNIN